MKYDARELFDVELLKQLKRGDIFYLSKYNETFLVLKNSPGEQYLDADCFWGDNLQELKMSSSYRYCDILERIRYEVF